MAMKILVVGAGDVGFQLSRSLSREGHDITVIEQDSRHAQRARDQLDASVVEGDASDFTVLQQTQLENIDVVAAMTNNDEANLLVCKMAKKAHVGQTIARVRNPQYSRPDFPLTPEDLGVDRIIHPEQVTARAIQLLLQQTCATYAVELEAGKIQLFGLRIGKHSKLVDGKLSSVIPRHDVPHMRIVAVSRNHHTLIPNGDSQLAVGDQIFAVCDPNYADELIQLSGQTTVSIDNLMIIGGGLVGRFVAQEMHSNSRVKIVENDEERAYALADDMKEVLVIHGDGTDPDLLAEEGLRDMDAFVATTGDDENNIISTLLARHTDVPRAIALVNKVDYLRIMPRIGLDRVVSKQLLTANEVQRIIQHRQVTTIASLPGINAQFVEYMVDERAPITRKPLSKVRFPKNAVVGAILHDDHVVIPDGSTQIEANDRVVVFTAEGGIDELDRVFKR